MEKWRVASCSFQFNTLVAAIACVSSRHEFTRGGELIRAFLSLPSSHLCISVLPFLPLFFTVSRAISHFASFSLSFLGDNRSIVSTNNSKTNSSIYSHRFLVSSRLYFFEKRIFPTRKNLGTKQARCKRWTEKKRFEEMFEESSNRLIESIENRYREYRFFFRHKFRSIDVYFERYLKRLVRLVLLDQE